MKRKILFLAFLITIFAASMFFTGCGSQGCSLEVAGSCYVRIITPGLMASDRLICGEEKCIVTQVANNRYVDTGTYRCDC